MLEAALIMKNTAKFQLNHFFKNTVSSVFNQFKHFLALSQGIGVFIGFIVNAAFDIADGLVFKG
jgi:hypothetical protein